MNILIEEQLVFILVMISVPSFVYAVEKLLKRKVYNRFVVILLYVLLWSIYLDILEKYYLDVFSTGLLPLPNIY